MDLLVGAPMFMVRDSDGRLEELGRVYAYLQTGPLELTPQLPHLTGTQTFGRFGSSIAPLGDLNQDGFNGEGLHLFSLLHFSRIIDTSVMLSLLSSVRRGRQQPVWWEG